MKQPDRFGRVVRFKDFEADLRTCELRKRGLRVRLPEQPFQILTMLLEQPGELVTREELQKRLWPADTFVEVDLSLNAAVRKLRQALGDDAESPRYIETLPRRGYRFIAPVDGITTGPKPLIEAEFDGEMIRRGLPSRRPSSPGEAVPAQQGNPEGVPLQPSPGDVREPLRSQWHLRLPALLGMGLVGLTAAWFATHRTPPPRPEPKPRRLTANPAGNPATHAHISPDGKYLAYADQRGIQLQLIDTGETRTISQPQGAGHGVTDWWPVGWFPDWTKLLAQATSLGAEHSSIWVVSILGGAPREIHQGGFAWSVSPDGALIAFTSSRLHSDIWLMGPDGEEPRKIVTANEEESIKGVVWSPDSRRIVYERFRFEPAGPRRDIETRDLKGGQPSVVLSNPKLATAFGGGFWWLPDGRMILTDYPRNVPDSIGERAPALCLADMNLWEIKVEAASGKAAGKPRRITNWTDFSLESPNASADGKRLVFGRVSAQRDAYVGELDRGRTHLKAPPRRLTLDERNDWPTAWTPDSKAVLFHSDRSGNRHIYKQALDQESAESLVATPQEDLLPRLSADGAWIIYQSSAKQEDIGTSAPSQLRRVPVSGGRSQPVLTLHGWVDYRCARAPATLCLLGEQTEDQKQLLFIAFDPVKGRGREVARIATNPGSQYNWDLSPDGSQIAEAIPGENRIRLLPVRGGQPRDIVINGWSDFNAGPDWAPDGKGFYVSSSSPRGATLLHVDLKGNVNALWEQKGSWQTWGVPSPDGRHLAILGLTVDSNVWMTENF